VSRTTSLTFKRQADGVFLAYPDDDTAAEPARLDLPPWALRKVGKKDTIVASFRSKGAGVIRLGGGDPDAMPENAMRILGGRGR
jgi:hypothetical protein